MGCGGEKELCTDRMHSLLPMARPVWREHNKIIHVEKSLKHAMRRATTTAMQRKNQGWHSCPLTPARPACPQAAHPSSPAGTRW